MDRLRALIQATQNPFHEEYDTLSRARELFERRGELGEQLGTVRREATKDVERAFDESANREIRVRQVQQQEDAKEAKEIVGGARDAAGRAADVAARVFNQAANEARPLVPKPPRPSRQAQEEAAAKRGPTKVGPFNRDELIESRAEGTALPGEEQVTSMQTLDALPPEVRAGLEKKYQSGGHADTMSFEDWVSENFSELPRDARTDAMRREAMLRSATSTPRIQAGRDPNLRPGEMSATAASRKAAGKPLPEGREPEQYTPEQRRTMSRNIMAPEVPMQRFGGTFAVNADGSISGRAPDPAKLELMQEIGRDQGEDSLAYLMASADAFYIDSARYGDDYDLLRADVARERERHERQMKSADTVPTNMGGFRYTPNAESREAARQRSVMNFAGDMVVRYGRLLSPEDQNQLLALGEAGDMQALQRFRARMEPLFRDQRTRAARDRAATFNMTRDMNNAAMAPGMRARALMQQIAENNPDGAAGVSQIFGDEQAVPMWLNRANAQAAADAQRAAVLAEEQDKEKAERKERLGPLGAMQDRITLIQDDSLDEGTRTELARTLVRDDLIASGVAAPDEQTVRREADVLIVSVRLPDAPTPDQLRVAFERFRNDRAAFYSLGARLRSRGVTQEMVDNMWAQMGPTAREQGQAAGQAAGDAWRGLQEWVGGFAGQGE